MHVAQWCVFVNSKTLCVPRRKWADEHRDWVQSDWSQVLLTDDSSFSLDCDARLVLELPFPFFSGLNTWKSRATYPGCRVGGQAASTCTPPVPLVCPWRCVHAWIRATPSVSSPSFLFLMNLRKLRSVSQLMVLLCSRNSTSSACSDLRSIRILRYLATFPIAA
ncbi:hypothetical protein TNCV_4132001 [Trichonephila clavipes]|nr:hypothetical protein TNCV_4132001 [Trichonephila clavipes]